MTGSTKNRASRPVFLPAAGWHRSTIPSQASFCFRHFFTKMHFGPDMRTLLSSLLLWLPLLATAPAGLAQTPGGQPPLPAVHLQSGLHLVKAEVANDYLTRMQGLMMREKMAASDGMLFVFPDREKQCMWMKSTLLPLSVAFIDEAGVILNIEDMKPQTENSHCSVNPARYALEMNLGWFKSKNIKAGSKISGLEKAGPPK